MVDNDIDDGFPLLEALAGSGVGALYLSGDPDRFPPRGSLRGVRLAVLDVNLADGARPPEEIAMDPVRVLDAVMDRTNGPYMVLLWTTHDELADLFREYVAELDWPPVSTCVFSKTDAKTDGEYDVGLIALEIAKQMAEVDPLQLMVLWGQAVHDAASATLESLGPDTTQNWIVEVRSLLGALLRENTPAAQLTDRRRALRSLFEALDQVHMDHLDVAAMPIADEFGDSIESVLAVAEQHEKTDVGLQCRMNRSLMLGPVVEEAAPGTIYVALSLTKPVQAGFEGLITDTLPPLPVNASQAKRDTYDEAVASAVPIVAELTPVCDHQQDAHTVVRLLGGLAVPAQYSKVMAPAGYLRQFPPMAFSDQALNGQYILCWNAHFMLSHPRAVLKTRKASYRIRQGPLSDLIAFHANHSSRPGYLAIRK